MQFARPENLYWLLVLVPLFIVWWHYARWKENVRANLGHQPLIDAMSNSYPPSQEHLRIGLFVAAVILMIIAIAQPQWGMAEETIPHTSADIVFALDLSSSMMAQDALPNRLDASKNEFRTVLSQLEGDRVGLVFFTSLSFVQSPLTTDYESIRFFLRRIHPDQIPIGGTSLGSAIRESVEILIGQKIDGSSASKSRQKPPHRAKDQLIVLMTDGEDHERAAMDAALLAQQYGIRILTVGIGSTSGTKIPVVDKQGNLTGHLRNQRGQIVETHLNEDILKEVARLSNGIYTHYAGPGSVANSVTDYIRMLERQTRESLTRNQFINRQMLFLTPAFLLLLISLLLSQRPGAWAAAKKLVFHRAIILCCPIVLSMFLGCQPEPISPIEQGNDLLEAGDFESALQHYQSVGKPWNETPEWHYNIGRAHLGMQAYEDAQSAFARALSSDTKELYADALYNLGLTLVAQEMWDEAYDAFRQTLAFQLKHAERFDHDDITRTQHNMELAFHELYPACKTLDDDLEPNDTSQEYAELDNDVNRELALCGANEDWYKIPIPGPDTKVSVDVDFTPLRTDLSLGSHLLTGDHDLGIALWDQLGNDVIASSQTQPEDSSHTADKHDPTDESIQYHRALNNIAIAPSHFVADEENAPYVLLQLKAAPGVELKYHVKYTAIQPCESLNPLHEKINTAERAIPIDSGAYPMHICPGDEAWLKVSADVEDTVFIDIAPSQDIERGQVPELKFDIIDSKNNTVVASSINDGAYLTAGLQNISNDGDYYIRIYGADENQQGPYQLGVYKYGQCPDADDRFAPNHDIFSPATLDEQINQRYLRSCPNRPDHFSIPVPEDSALQIGLSQIRPLMSVTEAGESVVYAPEHDRPTDSWQFNLLEEDGLHPILAGEYLHNGEDVPDTGLDYFMRVEDYGQQNALVAIQNDYDAYYHIVEIPENDQQDQQNQDEQNQDEQQQDQQNQDEQNQDEQQQDQQNQDEQNQDQQQQDQQNQDEQNQDEQDEAESTRSEEEDSPEDQSEEQQIASQEESMSEEERERIEAILQALEESDDNFQLQKAIRNLPNRYIQRNW